MPNETEKPRLVFDIQNPQPEWVQETMAVYGDGRCHLHVIAALLPGLRNQAGTFAAGPDEQRARQSGRLAKGLSALTFAGKPFRRAVQWSVTVHDGGMARSHLLSVTDETPLPGELQEASERFGDWKAQVEKHPYAVLQISARLGGTPQAPLVTVMCQVRGQQGIRFLLAPEGLALASEEQGVRREVWRAPNHLPMGLVDGRGQLIDGLNAPASLDAGGQAVLVLRPGMLLPAGGLYLSCYGYIALADPGVPLPDFPRTAVQLVCSIER